MNYKFGVDIEQLKLLMFQFIGRNGILINLSAELNMLKCWRNMKSSQEVKQNLHYL